MLNILSVHIRSQICFCIINVSVYIIFSIQWQLFCTIDLVVNAAVASMPRNKINVNKTYIECLLSDTHARAELNANSLATKEKNICFHYILFSLSLLFYFNDMFYFNKNRFNYAVSVTYYPVCNLTIYLTLKN